MGLILFIIPGWTFGQTAPTLGHAAGFVLFTTNGAMTCSGTKYLTHLTGDVGSDLAGSVTGFGNVDGVMHSFDVATGLCTPDVISLYTQLSTATPTATLASPFGGGTTLFAGVYHLVGASTLTSNLILDGQGNPNAVFIFQIGGVFSTNALSKVKLINGALACNVFWQVGGAVNVGTGTTLRGTIVANGQIDMTSTLDTLEGRALALNAAVLVSQLVAYTPIGCGSPLLTGPAAPAMLDSTAAYGVFSTIGAVTSTPVTYVIGNVGANSTTPTGFNPLNVTGTIHGMDFSTAAAAADLTNIYNYLLALPADILLLDPPDFGHDLVLTPHSYQLTGITQLTGSLYLNAEGDANAVFVIKISGSFTTGTLSKIVLINGAQAKNVYWKIDGAVDIYSNSVFNGTLVVAGAISLETGDTLNGRALTINGAIAINGSYVKITPKACTAPIIGGVKHACVGSTSTLTDSTLGGKWTSSDTLIARIDSNSGVVSGIAPGNALITYTTLIGCTNTANFTVNALPGAISGLSTVCVGNTITLTDTSAGGSWSSNNALVATVGSGTGVVAGVSAGSLIINYTMSTGCFISKSVTVNPLPDAGIISGLSNVCVGNSIVLTDVATGGIWSSTNNSLATVLTGTVTGVAAGVDSILYTVTNACGIAIAHKVITVNVIPGAGIITGLSNVCVGSNITMTDLVTGGVWSSSNANASIGTSGIVTGVLSGIDTIKYIVTGSCGSATATKYLTVDPLPNAGIISGVSNLCIGSTTTYTNSVGGGTWSSSNANATIGTTGLITGVLAGVDTITYTVTGSCGTATAIKVLTVNLLPDAGIISGASSVCVGSTTTYTNIVSGGSWSSSNGNAIIGTAGVITGVVAGVDTIVYTVSQACGTAVATKYLTVNPLPNAGSIIGVSGVCVGSSIALTDAATGGVWSSSNANAVVGTSGVVTGQTTGMDTISYSVANICGSASVTKIINVNPLPFAGVISGLSTVCIGSTIALTDGAPAGIWSHSNLNASVGVTGIVTGLVAGIDTITYSVSNSCGTATTSTSVTVNPLPNAGSISGATSLCVLSTTLLTDGIGGGTWSTSNANATVAAGLVTGISAGSTIVSYAISNVCGTAYATHTIALIPLPSAGSIAGLTSVCAGSSILLTDGVTGGGWSSSNTNAAIGISGNVTGITAGLDTINYTYTNVCGTAVATYAITINPLPNAGSISGLTQVCVGSAIGLSDGISGGTWSSSNIGFAGANPLTGTITGVAAGSLTISYTVSNSCGTATALYPIVVNPLPFAGTITGPLGVCVAASITLADATTGGTWSSSNTNAIVSGGIVTGVTAGAGIISYTVTNICGTISAIKAITIYPLPNAGSITGASSVCAGLTILLNNAITGGIWSSSNGVTSVTAGLVSGIVPGIDTIVYTVTNMCGTISTTKVVTVNALPYAGSITGLSAVCVGSSVILNNVVTGGTWSSNTIGASVGTTGVVVGVSSGTAIISFSVTNVCGTDRATKTIIVNPVPLVPVITTTGPTVACTGTMFQNFGTSNPSQALTRYDWTAVNAIVWAQGTGHNYALVSFTTPGTAYITLNATFTATGCTNKSIVLSVNVGTTDAQVAEVLYFNNHFVCIPANESSYQWGYDDAYTLDSTILTGEINQDYINFNPDFGGKKYWAMTTSGGCMQKSYFSTPSNVQLVNAVAEVMIYPNPASNNINVAVSSSVQGQIQFEVINMMGQSILSSAALDNKATIDVAGFSAGSYLVVCYVDGSKIATARFIKN